MNIVSCVWTNDESEYGVVTPSLMRGMRAHYWSYSKFNTSNTLWLLHTCDLPKTMINTLDHLSVKHVKVESKSFVNPFTQIYHMIQQTFDVPVIYTDIDTYQLDTFDFALMRNTYLSYRGSIKNADIQEDLPSCCIQYVDTDLPQYMIDHMDHDDAPCDDIWDYVYYSYAKQHGYTESNLGVCGECDKPDINMNIFYSGHIPHDMNCNIDRFNDKRLRVLNTIKRMF